MSQFQDDLLHGVLVHPEMESWRSPLASIPPFSTGQFGPHQQFSSGCWWTRQAAETATGFKKEIRLGGPHLHGPRIRQTKLAMKGKITV